MLLAESTVGLAVADCASVLPYARLDSILTSAEEALARAEASLRKASLTRPSISPRTSLQAGAFDAVVLEHYPEYLQG